MNFTLWNVSKSVELFWRKCIILPVLSAAIYETAPDGRCRCRRRIAPRRIRDAGAAAQSVRRSCRREPAGACRLRRRQRGAHRTPRRAGTPSARRRRALGSPFRNRFCGDGRRCPPSPACPAPLICAEPWRGESVGGCSCKAAI